jgi:hypothetical protein
VAREIRRQGTRGGRGWGADAGARKRRRHHALSIAPHRHKLQNAPAAEAQLEQPLESHLQQRINAERLRVRRALRHARQRSASLAPTLTVNRDHGARTWTNYYRPPTNLQILGTSRVCCSVEVEQLEGSRKAVGERRGNGGAIGVSAKGRSLARQSAARGRCFCSSGLGAQDAPAAGAAVHRAPDHVGRPTACHRVFLSVCARTCAPRPCTCHHRRINWVGF